MDIALTFTEHGDFDVMIQNKDLVGDESPVTPLTVSLFTDRLANPDDILPDDPMPGRVEGGDRRGWWGDFGGSDSRTTLMGSRLWLLSREKELASVVARAQAYAREALEWLVMEGGNYDISARDAGKGRLMIEGKAQVPGGTGEEERWGVVLDTTRSMKVLNVLGV